MNKFSVYTIGDKDLIAALAAKSHYRLDAVINKNLIQIFDRAKNGGTPVASGALRRWMRFKRADSDSKTEGEVGYLMEYAPHVEYGHRTRNGGFVLGQRYLQRNVETQKPILQKDLLDNLEKVK